MTLLKHTRNAWNALNVSLPLKNPSNDLCLMNIQSMPSHTVYLPSSISVSLRVWHDKLPKNFTKKKKWRNIFKNCSKNIMVALRYSRVNTTKKQLSQHNFNFMQLKQYILQQKKKIVKTHRFQGRLSRLKSEECLYSYMIMFHLA